MRIEPWQVPVLTMALLALPPSAHWLVGWVRRTAGPTTPSPTDPDDSLDDAPEEKVKRERWRTGTLALVTVVLLGVFVIALGAEAASVLTSVATAVSTIVSAAMTVRSFLDLQTLRRETVQSIQPVDQPPADP